MQLLSILTHSCLAQLDQHQTCKPLIVSVVSLNATGGNFMFFSDTSMLISYKITEMSDFCYLWKPRILALLQILSIFWKPHVQHFMFVYQCDGVLVCLWMCGHRYLPTKLNAQTSGSFHHLSHQVICYNVWWSSSLNFCVCMQIPVNWIQSRNKHNCWVF